MPTYKVQCGCGVSERWYSIHQGVPDTCVACQDRLTQIITPPVVRSTAGREAISKDQVLAQDLDAYKHLRGNGLQPKGIDGARHLENHASTQFEVETGVLFPDASAKKQVAEARKRADDYAIATEA